MASQSKIKAGHAYILIEALDKTDKVMRGIAQRLDALSRRFLFAGVQAGMMGTAISIPFGSAVAAARDFTDEILFLQSILGITDDQMAPLTAKIKRLGETTSFTSREVAQAGTALAQGGFSPKQVADSLQATLDMARGARMELGPAANVMVETLTTFGMEAAKATELADSFFIAAKNGTVEVQDLAASMSYVGLGAKAMGMSANETLAILSGMSKRMLTGTMAGTSLNQFLISLAANVDKVKGKLNINPFDKNNKPRPMLEVLKEVVGVLKNMPEGKKLPLLQEIFNVRGMRAGMALEMGNALEEVFSNVEEMGKSMGIARRNAEKMDSGIGGSIRRIISSFDRLKIEIGDALTKTFQEFEQSFLPIVRGLTKFVVQNQEVVRTVAKAIPVIFGFAGSMLVIGTSLRVTAISLRGFMNLFNLITFPLKFANVAVGMLWGGFTRLATILGTGMSSGLSAASRGLSLLASSIFQSTVFIGRLLGTILGFSFSLLSKLIPVLITASLQLLTFSFRAMATAGALSYLALKAIPQLVLKLISLTANLIFATVNGFYVFAQGAAQAGLFGAKLYAVISGKLVKVLQVFLPILVTVGQAFSIVLLRSFHMFALRMAALGVMMIGWVGTFLMPYVAAIWSAVAAWLAHGAALLASISPYLGMAAAIGVVLGGLIALGMYLYKKLPNYLDMAGDAFSSMLASLPGKFQGLLAALGPWSQSITAFIGKVAANIGQRFSVIPNLLGRMFGDSWDMAKTAFARVMWLVKKGDMEGAFQLAIDQIRGIWKVLVVDLEILWVHLSEAIKGIFFDMFKEIKKGITSMWASLAVGFIESAKGNTFINQFIKSVSGIDVQAEMKRGGKTGFDPSKDIRKGIDRQFGIGQPETPEEKEAKAAAEKSITDRLAALDKKREAAKEDFKKNFKAPEVVGIPGIAGGFIPKDMLEEALREAKRLNDIPGRERPDVKFGDTPDLGGMDKQGKSPIQLPDVFTRGSAEAFRKAYENQQLDLLSSIDGHLDEIKNKMPLNAVDAPRIVPVGPA